MSERNLLSGIGAGEGGVGWDPLTDGGPWRVDGLESIEVTWGIGRWRNVDKALPEPVETEEEFDGFGPGQGLLG